MKDEVDPNRFTGKYFTRHKAFPTSVEDYVIIIDGCKADRIMKKTRSHQHHISFWTLTGSYFPYAVHKLSECEPHVLDGLHI